MPSCTIQTRIAFRGALCGLRYDGHPWLEGEFAHANEVLRDLGQSLLVFVHQELWPASQVLIDLLQRLHVLRACKLLNTVGHVYNTHIYNTFAGSLHS
jgi:hypothetical protein